MKRICSIYQSSKRSGMYLYVLKSDALERVPEALMLAFGKAKHSFDLVLSPERKLASEDIVVVLENLDKQGYHLQMPPAEDEYIEHLPEELLRRNDPV
ncbi:YcgL domain-containing protein [Pseudomonas sp. P155]|uniref:YcgL domain-containing protein H8F23_05835 n=1 Tax=Pseudomonas neuropathica TaxID=2730425 RepID=A0ABS0BE68_9PSED|nr:MULTISPECIES: YcgL domain-containing protein [Pseudomonas]MBF6032767.1 YcgL domain-containing protein [Pseudomonas neuropathica]